MRPAKTKGKGGLDRKYLSNDDVKRLEETLKSYVLRAQTQCEYEKMKILNNCQYFQFASK